MKPEIKSVHVNVTSPTLGPNSITFDEEEFNDGSIDWNDMVNGLLAEGYTNLKIEVTV